MTQNELTYFIDGLKLMNQYGEDYNNQSYVIISPGRITFNKKPDNQNIVNYWNFNFEYVNPENEVLYIGSYSNNSPVVVSVYAIPNKKKKYGKYENGISFKIVKESDSYYNGVPIDNSGKIFLGMIYIPANYTTNDKIYFKSVSEFSTSYSIGKNVKEFYNSIQSRIDEWKPETIYFKNQKVINDYELFKCQVTHSSSSLFNDDFTNSNWEYIELKTLPIDISEVTNLQTELDNINTILLSNDIDLDKLQEVVDYIKDNRDALNSLGIGNISGLQTALNTKVDKVTGKGLSENDLTNALKSDYDGAVTDSHTHSNKTDLDAYDPADFASSSHNHSGVYEPIISKNTAFNKNFGTVSGTVCQGNDSRLSDARTPTAHNHDDRYYTETEADALLDAKYEENDSPTFTEINLTGSPSAIAAAEEVVTARWVREKLRYTWIERCLTTASDAGAGDWFGAYCSLNSDGTILAVGARNWDGGGGSNQGAMYIFDWNGSNWVERTTALTASDPGNNDYFGASCSLNADGTILAVCAIYWDGGAGNNQGAVYIFDWNGSNWVERTTALTPSDAGAGDSFGSYCSLNADGTVLAVGARDWDGVAGTNQGTVYIFDWNGSSWVERTTALTPSDAGAYDYFGISCSLNSDGTVLAVGAMLWDGVAGSAQGAMYIFDWNGSNWVERTTALTPSDPDANDHFGMSCSLNSDGTVLAVGASGWHGVAGSAQGAMYIFDWNGSNWVERTTALTASDAGMDDYFGYSCSLNSDGTILAVGARNWDGGAGSGQGAVYTFNSINKS